MILFSVDENKNSFGVYLPWQNLIAFTKSSSIALETSLQGFLTYSRLSGLPVLGSSVIIVRLLTKSNSRVSEHESIKGTVCL